jgi:3-dehydroquinate synthase
MVTKPIALWGFMGSGKTSVGKALAQKLGYEFVDTDELIAQRFGKPIPQIFAEDGEAAFRRTETQVLSELIQRQRIVLATGGGMPTVPENLALLRLNALNFYLRVPVEVLYERLATVQDRPLLQGFPDRYFRIASLLAQRERFYTQAQFIVPCGRQTPEQIAERIFAWVRALDDGDDAVTVNLSDRSYPVIVGDNLLERLERIFAAVPLNEPFAIIADESVAELLGKKVHERLQRLGKAHLVTVPSGEGSKSVEQAIRLWQWLADLAFPSDGTVAAVGGGVVGDLSGFVAATYMRGVAFAQIPTTLLAMVDSAIGGKTAIDLPQAKNLVGAFHQPRLVLCDLATLATMPDRPFLAGLAEVVKYGVIADPALFAYLDEQAEWIVRRHPTALRAIIVRSASVKASVVAADEREETGLRMVLNYGHTFGHALEAATGFSLLHGEAVAIGMTAEAYLAWRLGLCDREVLERQTEVLRKLDLPTRLPQVPDAPSVTLDTLMAAMGRDKKRRGATLRFALPKRLGEVTITDAPVPETLLTEAWEFVKTAATGETAATGD